MPTLKVYLTEDQYTALHKLAEADGRSMSNYVIYATHIQATRTKKKDKDGKVIRFPLRRD